MVKDDLDLLGVFYWGVEFCGWKSLHSSFRGKKFPIVLVVLRDCGR